MPESPEWLWLKSASTQEIVDRIYDLEADIQKAKKENNKDLIRSLLDERNTLAYEIGWELSEE